MIFSIEKRRSRRGGRLLETRFYYGWDAIWDLRSCQGFAADTAVCKGASTEAIRQSLSQLFSTGLYETVQAEGLRTGEGVSVIFHGTPRMFVGTVGVDGARGSTINTQLASASQLQPATALKAE